MNGKRKLAFGQVLDRTCLGSRKVSVWSRLERRPTTLAYLMNVFLGSTFFAASIASLLLVSPAAARDWDDRHDRDSGPHRGGFHDDDHRFNDDEEAEGGNMPFAKTEIGKWFYGLGFGWIAGILSIIGAGMGVLWRGLLLFREVRRPGSTLDSP
ncbi:MAG: hypothetical protein ACI8UO_001404 [Verrucomicrobiales bacterium]